jgi:hypothetical protein
MLLVRLDGHRQRDVTELLLQLLFCFERFIFAWIKEIALSIFCSSGCWRVDRDDTPFLPFLVPVRPENDFSRAVLLMAMR